MSAVAKPHPSFPLADIIPTLSQEHAAEISALSVEQDPDILRHGLLAFSRRLIEEERENLALPLLASLESGADEYAREGKSLREMLLGGGSFANRVEHTSSAVFREVRSPAFFAGIAAGSLAVQALRVGVLSRAARYFPPRRAPSFWRQWIYGWNANGSSPAFAGAASGLRKYEKNPVNLAWPSHLRRPDSYSLASSGGGVGRPPGIGPFPDRLGLILKLPPQDGQVAKILRSIQSTPFTPQESYQELIASLRLPARTIVPLGDGYQTFSAADLLEHATWQFKRTMELDPRRKGFGNIYDYLVQAAFEESLSRGAAGSFRDLVSVVGGFPTMNALRHFFEKSGIAGDYQLSMAVRHSPPGARFLEERVDELMLDRRTRSLIKSYFALLQSSAPLPGFLHRDRNVLLFHQRPALAVTAERSLRALEETVWFWESQKDWDSVSLLDNAFLKAAASGIPLLYLDYLFKVLMTGDYAEKIGQMPKLAEIALEEEFIWAEMNKALQNARSLEGSLSRAEDDFSGTVYTGYLNDADLTRRLIALYDEAPRLTADVEAARLRNGFENYVRDLLAEHPGRFREIHIQEMLARNATTASRMAADWIVRGKIDFKLVGDSEMKSYWKKPEPLPVAMFVPPQHRIQGDSPLPLLALLDQWHRVPPEGRISYALHLCRCVVHEFAHFLHDYQGGQKGFFSSFGTQLSGEFFAANEDQLYALSQGFTEEWKHAIRNPYGWPGHLRGEIEKDYLIYPKALTGEKWPRHF